MESKGFSAGQMIKDGWRLMRGAFSFFAVFLVINFLIALIPAIVVAIYPDMHQWAVVLMHFFVWVFEVAIWLGFIRSCMRVVEGEKPTFKDLVGNFGVWLKFVVASILYGLIVLVGFLLLIFPAGIWGAKFGLFPFVILDKKLGPIKALEESSRLTNGSKWDVFLLFVGCYIINLLGLLCLGVGLLFTLPLTMFAQVLMYKKLLQ